MEPSPPHSSSSVRRPVRDGAVGPSSPTPTVGIADSVVIQVTPKLDSVADAEQLIRSNPLGGAISISFVSTKLDDVYSDNLYAYARFENRIIAVAAVGKRTLRALDGRPIVACYGHSAHVDQRHRLRAFQPNSRRPMPRVRARDLLQRLFPAALRRFDARLIYFQIAADNRPSLTLARMAANALARDPLCPAGVIPKLKLIGRLTLVPILANRRPVLEQGWRVERVASRAAGVLTRLREFYARHRLVDLPESFDPDRYYVLIDRHDTILAGAQVGKPLRFRLRRLPTWLTCLADLAQSIDCIRLVDQCVDVCLFYHLLGESDGHRMSRSTGRPLTMLLAWLKADQCPTGLGGVLIDSACPMFRQLTGSPWWLRAVRSAGLLDGRYGVGMWAINLDPTLDTEIHDATRPVFSSPLDN